MSTGPNGGDDAAYDVRLVNVERAASQPLALVVDDSRAVRAAVRGHLERAGWAVCEASDGEEGAVAAAALVPGVIVCDHVLVGITGTQLCRLLREDPRTAQVPMVLMTASPSARGQFWAIESGARGYLDKSALSSLAQLVERFRVAAPQRPCAREPSAGARRGITARLAHLLDDSLFEADVARRIRGASAVEADVAGLFQRVGSLLGALLAFRWVALGVCGHEPRAFVMCHPSDARALTEARGALLSGPEPVAPRVVHEEACVCVGGGVVESRLLRFGDRELGALAVGLAGDRASRDEVALLELFARELPPVLKLVALLEDTQRMALSDQLTGLPNRRAGLEYLERVAASHQRRGAAACVALLDIDHFKRVNDTWGHRAGDAVLVEVARRARASVRRADLVARWGGEEFLLVLPDTDPAGAGVVCERVRAQLAATPVRCDTRDVAVTASIGVTVLSEREGARSIDRADALLYEAKRAGRNRVCLGG